MRGPALLLANVLCMCSVVAAQQPEVAQDPVAVAQQVLASAAAVHGADSLPAASAQLALARALFARGEADAAAAAANASLAVFERHGPDQELAAADALLLLGASSGVRDDLVLAAASYRRALAIRERHDAPGAPYLQLMRFNLAATLQALADNPAALELAMAGLADARGAGPPSLAAGNFECLVALSLDGLGRYQEAFEHYQRGEQILRARRGADFPDTLRMMGLAGVMLCRMGRAEEGLQRIAAALAAMRQNPQVRPELLAELETGEVVMRMLYVGDEAAAAALRACLTQYMSEPRGDADGTRLMMLLAILDHVDPAAIDLDLARRALLRCEALLGAEHVAVAGMQFNMGRMLYSRGEKAEAIDHMQRAVTILDDAPWFVGVERWWIRWGVANMHHLAGDDAAALAMIRSSLAELPRLLEAWTAPLDERQRIEVTSTTRAAVDLELSIGDATASPIVARWQSVLAWKGMVSRGLLQSLQWLHRNRDAETQRLAEALRASVGRWSALVRNGTTGQAVVDAQRERESIEAELARRLVARATGAPDPRAIAAALAADEVLVDYFTYGHQRLLPGEQFEIEERLLAFVVRRGAAPVLVELGPLAAITPSVVAFLQVAARWTRPVAGATELVTAAGTRVAELVWAPLRERIPAGARVILCPDSVVALVPFACLPGQTAGTFLLEEHEFVYVASAGDVVDRAVQLPGGEQPTLLAVGAVDYGDQLPAAGARAGLRAFTPLPGSGPEIDTIAGLFRAVSKEEPILLRGPEATVERVARTARGATFLHIATHGWFSGSRELPDAAQRWRRLVVGGGALSEGSMAPGAASGIALAGANRPAEAWADGALTADEIALLDLGHCELAVLSACETALGTVSAGDGLLGLRRALRLAGAKRSLTTVWRVDDGPTLRCMQAFYRALWPLQQSPAAALRAAQRAMLEAARAENGQALVGTWGAFVLEAR